MDARIPVRFGPAAEAGPEEAVLVEAAAVPAGRAGVRFDPEVGAHVPGCACCVARSAAALGLAALFQMRARGEVAFFRGVVAVVGAAGEAMVRGAIEADAVASARFRVIGD